MTDINAPIFATVTPFDDTGAIDEAALERYLSFLTNVGVQSILSGGTTGEFPSLTLAERMALLEMHRSHFSGGTILQNISAPAVADARLLAQHARGVADAAVLLPPYYFAGVSSEGICQYYAEVMRGIDLPVLIYNFPKHSGNVVAPEMFARLSRQFGSVVGVKDSSGDLSAAAGFHRLVPQAQVFVGGDSLAADVLEAGLAGSVTGTGNAFPEFHLSLSRLYQEGSPAAAVEVQQLYNQWNAARKEAGVSEIPLVKEILSHRIEDFQAFVRPPLKRLNSEIVAGLLSLGLTLIRKIQEIE